MPEGRYDYKFSFELPKSKLPSSYEGINGNYIRYFVEASIHVPWKKYEPKARKAVTILELVDCNKIEFMVSQFTTGNLFKYHRNYARYYSLYILVFAAQNILITRW